MAADLNDQRHIRGVKFASIAVDIFLVVGTILAGGAAAYLFLVNLRDARSDSEFHILGGPQGGQYQSAAYAIGEELSQFKSSYSSSKTNRYQRLKEDLFSPLRNIDAKPGLPTNGSADNIDSIERDTSGNTIGFCQDGDLRRTPQLMALVPAYTSYLQIFVRSKNGSSVEFAEVWKHPEYRRILFSSIAAKEAFIAVGAQYSSEVPERRVYRRVRIPRKSAATSISGNYDEAIRAVSQGHLDVFVALVGPEADFLGRITSRNLTLVRIDRRKAVTEQSSGLVLATVPRGAYAGREELPRADIDTVGTQEILACNSALSDRNAFDLVQRLQLLPRLRKFLPDMSRAWNTAEAVTSTAMHPGALKFFRRQELDPPISNEVLGYFVAFALGIFAKFRRLRVRKEIKALDLQYSNLTDAELREEQIRETESRLFDVRYSAFTKLRHNLADDTDYSGVKEYCDIVREKIHRQAPSKSEADASTAGG